MANQIVCLRTKSNGCEQARGNYATMLPSSDFLVAHSIHEK